MSNKNNSSLPQKQRRIDRPADFIQIDLSWMDDVACELSNEELGIALRLMAYCFKHPNSGGIIENAREWTSNKWLIQAYGLKKECLEAPCPCWHWDNTNLVIDCCPDYVHKLMEARLQGQENGKKGHEKRWGARPKIAPPIAPPIAEYEESSMQYEEERMEQQTERGSRRPSDSVSGSCRHEPEVASLSKRQQDINASEREEEPSPANLEKTARDYLGAIYKTMGYLLTETTSVHEIYPYIQSYWDYLPDLSDVPGIIQHANKVPHAISALQDWSERCLQQYGYEQGEPF
jgi:hypothetical protein